MNSLILSTTVRFFQPMLLFCSIVILLRGHNDPGGGFVGGLLAAAAFTLEAISSGTTAARRSLRVEPHFLLGAGLLTAMGSGLPGLLRGKPILTGQWLRMDLPLVGEWTLGTVLLFDVGVFLVVLGTVLLMVFTLSEES